MVWVAALLLLGGEAVVEEEGEDEEGQGDAIGYKRRVTG